MSTGTSSLLNIISDLGATCEEALKTSPKKILEASILKGNLLLIDEARTPRKIRASAIYKILEVLFPKLENISADEYWANSGKADGGFYGFLKYGPAAEILTKLAEHLFEVGEVEEAQLCALQSTFLPDYRRNPVGKKMFGKMKLQSEKFLNSSSAVSSVTKLCSMVQPNENFESLFAADNILQTAAEAIGEAEDMGEKKLKGLLEGLAKVKNELTTHPCPAVQCYSRVL